MKHRLIKVFAFVLLLATVPCAVWASGNDVEFSIGAVVNPSIVHCYSASSQVRSDIGNLIRDGDIVALMTYSGVECLWRITGWTLPLWIGGSIGASPIGLFTDALAGTGYDFLDDGVHRIGIRAILGAGAAFGVGAVYDVGLRAELVWRILFDKPFGMALSAGLQARSGYPALRFSIPLSVALVF